MTKPINSYRHVVGVFESEQAVISAIEDLKSIGYTSDQISVISRSKDEMNAIQEETGTNAPDGALTGAAAGGVLGGVTGLLAGLGLLAIPGIGPLLAAGPIVATITGAAVGAGAGGLVGGLIGLGIPKEEAERYNDYVNDHKLLVLVEAVGAQRNLAQDVFRRYSTLNSDMYVRMDGEDRDDLVDAASNGSAGLRADRSRGGMLDTREVDANTGEVYDDTPVIGAGPEGTFRQR
jgi:hypothetical protein